MSAWQASYGAKVDIKEWRGRNGMCYGSYFPHSKPDGAKKWIVTLGPLGVRTWMHDLAWRSYSAFRALYPPCLVDGGGLIHNALEVRTVHAGGPADGHLQVGDLILEMEGEPLRSAQSTYPDREILARDTRGLEMHAGQLIDAAEGRGRIRMKIIRPPSTNPNDTDAELPRREILRFPSQRAWRQLAGKVMKSRKDTAVPLELNVPIQDCYSFRLVATDGGNGRNYDGMHFDGVRLRHADGRVLALHELRRTVSNNGYGRIRIDEEKNVWNVHAPCEFAFLAPDGEWTLEGRMGARNIATVELKVETIARPQLPDGLAPYIREIEFEIPQVGSFGERFDPASPKLAATGEILAHRLLVQQQDNGSWAGVYSYARPSFYTSMCGLGLLAAADPAYEASIRRAAHYVAYEGGKDTWAYVAGTRPIFLAEYYLRTRDESILDGLREAVAHAKSFVLPDYTAGHKHHPGYGGSGYIGGGGTISCALALAAQTPAGTDADRELLDAMLARAQELAPQGGIPYGRSQGSRAFNMAPNSGKGWCVATGPYVIAAQIRGGPDYFLNVTRKRFTTPPYGNSGAGHATQTISFIWSCLAINGFGSDYHRQNMDTYLWQLTTYRNYDGLINGNLNRLEYHGGDGVIGYPYWQTGAYLLLLNAHKRNLAITGKPEFRADPGLWATPTVADPDKAFWKYMARSWSIAEAALGDAVPSSLATATAKLRAMPKGPELGPTLFEFVQAHAPAIAKDVAATAGPDAPQNQYCLELVLGTGCRITAKDAGDGKWTVTATPFTPFTQWRSALPKDSQKGHPAEATFAVQGAVTLSDPSGKVLAKPQRLAFGQKHSVSVPQETVAELTATVTYTVAGQTVSYSRPFAVGKRRGPEPDGGYRYVWVPGAPVKDTDPYTWRIRLPSGHVLNAAVCSSLERVRRPLLALDASGAPFRFEKRPALPAGMACRFLVTPGNRWQSIIRGVHFQEPYAEQ